MLQKYRSEFYNNEALACHISAFEFCDKDTLVLAAEGPGSSDF